MAEQFDKTIKEYAFWPAARADLAIGVRGRSGRAGPTSGP